MSGDTRRRLLDAAIATLRDQGITGASARAIAAAAGVNQALVFYHFGSVSELIGAACREGAAVQAALYRQRFKEVSTLRELFALGMTVHTEQRDAGHVTVLSQVLAGARRDPGLASAAREGLLLWITEIEMTLQRLLKDSPVADVADPHGLAAGLAAAFVGIELYEAADPDGAASAFGTLEQLAVVTEVLDDLGPVARHALRRRMRSRRTAP